VVSVPIPSEAAQLAFLRNVQRLLEEGQFTATYKFALLVALVDIAIERGRDDGEMLRVSLRAIAEKFVEAFWGHTRPYRGGVLFQNKGNNIALLGILEQAQAHAATLADLRRNPKWEPLLKQVARQVELMPLLKLQTLRGDRKLLFLYQEEVKEGAIELLPGVAFCLRRFSGFLRTLAQHGWLNEVRRNSRNAYLIGSGENLEEFLFGDDRVPLGVVREILWPMQDGRCFYCGERMNAGLHVDHFVPFVLHPANLGHNLVLAHAACNSDKSDLLADLPYLERWASRNETKGAELSAAMGSRGIVSDLDSTIGIARWAYGRARESEAALWMRRGETRPFPRGATLSI
jgi:hypothetical protein